MLKQAIQVFVGAGALGLVFTAAAQPDKTGAKETAAPVDDAPIIVPRKSRVPSIAAAAASGPVKSADPVDWNAVKEEVEEAKPSDAEFQRQVRAMELTRPLSESEKQKMRPKGLRTAAPQQFKRVTSGEVRETRVPVLVPMLPDFMQQRLTPRRAHDHRADRRRHPREAGQRAKSVGRVRHSMWKQRGVV